MLPAVKHYPISVEMYHIMAERGTFPPDERVELIDGKIIEMSPVESRHARVVDFLNDFLGRSLQGRFYYTYPKSYYRRRYERTAA